MAVRKISASLLDALATTCHEHVTEVTKNPHGNMAISFAGLFSKIQAFAPTALAGLQIADGLTPAQYKPLADAILLAMTEVEKAVVGLPAPTPKTADHPVVTEPVV